MELKNTVSWDGGYIEGLQGSSGPVSLMLVEQDQVQGSRAEVYSLIKERRGEILGSKDTLPSNGVSRGSGRETLRGQECRAGDGAGSSGGWALWVAGACPVPQAPGHCTAVPGTLHLSPLWWRIFIWQCNEGVVSLQGGQG